MNDARRIVFPDSEKLSAQGRSGGRHETGDHHLAILLFDHEADPVPHLEVA